MKITKAQSVIIKLLIAAIAVGYLVYRLVTFDRWPEAGAMLEQAFKGHRFLYLAAAFILIFLNFSAEAVKWQRLVNRLEPTGYPKALMGVITSLAMAISTPGRIGDVVTRGLILKPGNRFAASGHTFVCIMAQMVMTVALGLMGAAIFFATNWQRMQVQKNSLLLSILIAGVLGLILIILFFILDKLTGFLQRFRWLKAIYPFLRSLEGISSRDKVFLLIISTLKFLTYVLQFYVILLFFGVTIGLVQGTAAISLIYMILHFLLVPTVGDLGVRGSVSLLIIGVFTPDVPAIVFTTFAVWIINIMIPSIIGLILLRKVRLATAS
jgi:hypothetical protein